MMKRYKKILVLILLLLPLIVSSRAQDCSKFFKKGECKMERQRGYKIYSQSRGAAISFGDTLEFDMVFYGQKDYIFSFCTENHLYPIHYRLLDPATRNVLYDNADDSYIESLGCAFDSTRDLILQIAVRAHEPSDEPAPDAIGGCMGVLIQYKPYGK